MEVQLQELLEKIKKEGLQSAEETANKIITEAEKKAADIISKAKKEAEDLVSKAKSEIDKMERTGKEALKQSGRDLLISMEKKLISLFNTVVQRETSAALQNGVLEDIIVKLLSSWKDIKEGDISLLLSKKDYEALEKNLLAKLSAELGRGIEIKPNSAIAAGFKVSVKDGAAYYNFTEDGIAEALCDYLNPKLSALLQEAVRKEE